MEKEFNEFNGIFSEETANKLNALLLQYINLEVEDSIEIRKNLIQESEDTQGIVKKAIKKFYNSKEYQTALINLVKNVNNSVDNRIDYLNKNVAEIQNKEVNPAIKKALNYHLSFLNEQGLNEKFNQPLRKIIYERINKGSSLKQLKQSLKDNLDTNSFTKYSKNLITQASSAYDGIVNQTIVDKYKSRVKGFMMVGTLIETSSDACNRFVELNRKLTLKQIEEEIIPLTKEWIDDPLDMAKVKCHYACRHSFIPILNDF